MPQNHSVFSGLKPVPEFADASLLFPVAGKNIRKGSYICNMKLPGITFLRNVIASLRPLEKWIAGLALLLLVAERVWFLFQYPVHTDEAYTFTHFTNGGIWRSMSYYPLPNNHIFFSVITAAFHYILPDAFWSLRLPSLLISLVVTVYLFLVLKRFAGFWVALLGVGLFCFSNLGIYYSFHARGYFLMTGLSAAAAFCLLQFIRTGRRSALWLFGLASVLGFYTVPVFLYPFVALAGFGFSLLLLLRDSKKLTAFIIAGLGIGLVTLLLYLPVFAVSGITAIIGNEYV
ncbi:MAG TPA: glycosyltransferase family 39 protein, partial [Adhaeribacter sp.]|nr:glycosyltransferase family 39 protein [Adhaeribacter sp.]